MSRSLGQPTETAILPARGPLAKIIFTWTRQEILLLLREPVAVFFSLAFPLIIYLFIGYPFANQVLDHGIRYIDYMFPTLIGTVAANLLLMGLPIYLAELRSRGVDRRYRVMPLPTGVFAIATILSSLTLVACSSTIIIGVVGTFNGLRGEVLHPAFIGLNLLLVGWLCCLGYFLGALPTTARATQAISAAIFFLMFFGSGAAMPVSELPKWLKEVLQFNPLKHWFDLLPAIYTSTPIPDGALWKSLLVLPFAALLALLGLRMQRNTIS